MPEQIPDWWWSDTTPHYWHWGGASVWYNLCRIEIGKPDANNKRAFEDASTGYNFVHGFFALRDTWAMRKLTINALVGAYHGYNATRAHSYFVVGESGVFDVTPRPSGKKWIAIQFKYSILGYPNGSYNRPLSGYLLLTYPPSYSFQPRNPDYVIYENVDRIPGSFVNVLYGYVDWWSADWDVWASLNKSSSIMFSTGTKPPDVQVLKEYSLGGIDVMIAVWDGEHRIWIKGTGKNKGVDGIISIGKVLKIKDVQYKRDVLSLNKFDKVFGSGKEKQKRFDAVTIRAESDMPNIHRKSEKVVIKLMHNVDDNRVTVVMGDEEWDGDKIAYYIYEYDITD